MITRILRVILVTVYIALVGTGCSLFPLEFREEPCSLNHFVKSLNGYPGQTQLQIGFSSQGSFFSANPDGENKSIWANGIYPLWSPDRKNIAYQEAGSICFSNDDGSQIRKVAQVENLSGLSWSPDGKFVVYSDLKDNNQFEIFMVSIDGEITQLTFSPDADDQSPAWSPDSKKIAFVTYSDPIDTGGYIVYTVTISILNTHSKKVSPVTLDGFEPVWSPDGNRILFTSVDNNICVVDTDGKNKSCLTSGFHDYAPQWSPDGKQIAFTRINKGWSIYIMNSAGDEQIRLVNGIFPVWSPDGQKIAFSTGGDTPYIYVINVDGTEQNLIAKKAWGYIWFQP